MSCFRFKWQRKIKSKCVDTLKTNSILFTFNSISRHCVVRIWSRAAQRRKKKQLRRNNERVCCVQTRYCTWKSFFLYFILLVAEEWTTFTASLKGMLDETFELGRVSKESELKNMLVHARQVYRRKFLHSRTVLPVSIIYTSFDATTFLRSSAFRLANLKPVSWHCSASSEPFLSIESKHFWVNPIRRANSSYRWCHFAIVCHVIALFVGWHLSILLFISLNSFANHSWNRSK